MAERALEAQTSAGSACIRLEAYSFGRAISIKGVKKPPTLHMGGFNSINQHYCLASFIKGGGRPRGSAVAIP
ncbi:hypothetical protein GX441_02450 [bacterium]|nr:hypothetical protein [bacterium]